MLLTHNRLENYGEQGDLIYKTQWIFEKKTHRCPSDSASFVLNPQKNFTVLNVLASIEGRSGDRL